MSVLVLSAGGALPHTLRNTNIHKHGDEADVRDAFPAPLGRFSLAVLRLRLCFSHATSSPGPQVHAAPGAGLFFGQCAGQGVGELGGDSSSRFARAEEPQPA